MGICIGASMLHKLRRDLLAGTSTGPDGAHEQERVHQLDHSVYTGVRTPHRHVRTRLYFTSESHIHSLFNVLRWGSSGAIGEPCTLFSDEAHALFHNVELGYLTHIVLRVLLRKGMDEGAPTSYRVQVLVSPGIEHHDTVCETAAAQCKEPRHAAGAAADGTGQPAAGAAQVAAAAPAQEPLQYTKQLMLASSGDLTLDEVDDFLAYITKDTDDYEWPGTTGGAPTPAVTRPRGASHT